MAWNSCNFPPPGAENSVGRNRPVRSRELWIFRHNIAVKLTTSKEIAICVYDRLITASLFIYCLGNAVISVIFRPTRFSAPGGGMLDA
jgi:hypothetical protein